MAGKGVWNRREALGFAAASVVVAGCKPAGREQVAAAAPAGIANLNTAIEVASSKSGALQLTALRNRHSGFDWLAGAQLSQPRLTLAQEQSVVWEGGAGQLRDGALALKATAPGSLESELLVESWPDTGAFRWQQAYRNGGARVSAVRGMSALDLELRGDLGDVVVHCVRRDSDYFREALPFRERVEVSGGGWNAPKHTGLIILEASGHAEFLVLGVQQERGWVAALERKDGRTKLTVSAVEMEQSLVPGQQLTAPALFVGACGGNLDDAVNLALTHLRTRVLPRPLGNMPWVSYDIWSTDATAVEQRILEEIPLAARLGVELFYLDASWYKGSSLRGTGDWGKGLGTYEEDRKKFPRGLRYLSDQVHAAGMKFGLWVGPNIVDAALVPAQIPDSWIAQTGGKRNQLTISSWEHPMLQVCLGSPQYTEHLKRELTRLVGDYNLDWIKWDNSGIPGSPAHCDRADHGHAAGDGSAAALRNEYAVFAHLHEKFPNLTLEQCGFGSRLDYGRAGYVRANWCSDTTYPSERVRSNAMACATVYPSGCNASWIVSEDKDFFATSEQHHIDTGIRSRMIGLFGVGTLNGQMSQRASLYPPKVLERLAANIAIYKQYRHLLFEQVSFPFAPYGRSPQGWEAVQFTSSSGLEAVVICFRGTSSQAESVVRCRHLRSGSQYRVRRVDAGTDVRVSGRELMESGLLLQLAAPGASEIIRIQGES